MPRQEFCHLLRWVQAADNEFHNAIENLCMAGSFGLKRRRGITLVWPPAKERAEIVKLAESKPAEAAKRIKACLLPDYFAEAKDFTKKNVGNLLGFTLDAKVGGDDADSGKTGGDKVKIGKATLTLVKVEFINHSHENPSPMPIAVWESDTALPTEGKDAYKAPPPEKKNAKKGGDASLSMYAKDAGALRRHMFEKCLQDYIAFLRGGGQSTKERPHPFVAAVASLLNFIDVTGASAGRLDEAVDLDPVVWLALLLEPYKKSGHRVPDDVLVQWNGRCTIYGDASAELIGRYAALAVDPSSSLGQIIKKHEIRGDLSNNGDKVNTPARIRAYYENDVARLWRDEMRFLLHLANMRLVETAQSERVLGDMCTGAEILELVAERRPGNDYEKEATLTSAERFRVYVDASSAFGEMKVFILSDAFLFSPIHPDYLEKLKGSGKFAAELAEYMKNNAGADPSMLGDNEVFFMDIAKADALKRQDVKRGGPSAASLAEMQFFGRKGPIAPEPAALRGDDNLPQA